MTTPDPELWQPLQAYHDHVYVLTLQRSRHRHERFAQRFAGLEYGFYYGVDKSSLDVAQIAASGAYSESLARRRHRKSKLMTAGQIACSLGHRGIYEDMVKNGHRRVLIFEDDAVPNWDAFARIPAMLAELPPQADLIWWSYGTREDLTAKKTAKIYFYHLLRLFGAIKWNHRIIHNLYLRNYSPHLRRSGYHDYACAYTVTQNAARTLIAMQTPLQYVADNLLAEASADRRLESFSTVPKLFFHDDLPDGRPRDSYIQDQYRHATDT